MKNWKIISCLPLFFLLLVPIGCSKDRSEFNIQKDRVVGVKIYEHEGSLPDLFEEWQSLGINTAFVSDSLYSNPEFRRLAKNYGIMTFIIFPVFYNPQELQERPGLSAVTDEDKKASEEWVSFICPTRQDYLHRRIQVLKELIEKLNPDGISLDFIRYFVYWEKIYPERTLDSLPNTCFDAHCLRQFQEETNIRIPGNLQTTVEIASWIERNHLTDWADWKCQIITNVIKNIVEEAKQIKPDLLINVHAVPWRKGDFDGAIRIIAGQDFTEISKYTNFLSPMCYHHMVKRKPAWIGSVVKDIDDGAKTLIIPSIQVKEAYLEEKLIPEVFRKALEESLKSPSHGVVFWSWEQLEQDPIKKGIIKEVISFTK